MDSRSIDAEGVWGTVNDQRSRKVNKGKGERRPAKPPDLIARVAGQLIARETGKLRFGSNHGGDAVLVVTPSRARGSHGFDP